MSFRIIQSKHNARLRELRQTLVHPNRVGRSALDDQPAPLAGIEGLNLLEEALRAGLRVDCVFAALGAEHLLDAISLRSETEILLLPRELLNSVLTTEAPQPIAALVEAPAWSWDLLLAPERKSPLLLVILGGLQDPGNLGTVLRSAEAFGAHGAISLPGTVSAWNSKAVRASAGSVFRLPLLAATAEDLFPRLRDAGVRIFTTAVHGAEPLPKADLTGPVALIIGNEGNGVPPELAEQADSALTIPCPGPVESLNASVAASILLYEASRQRSETKLSRRAK
jgi:TrmH family RNA methyltransferase